MAVFNSYVKSTVLNMRTNVQVVMPEYPQKAERTLILLHGLSGSSVDWLYRSSIARYAEQYNMAVLMPEVQRSWYCDMRFGLDYFSFVSEELLPMMASFFHIPTDPEHVYIGGLSMGAYGTGRCAFTHPERFAGAMMFSGRLNLHGKIRNHAKGHELVELQGILGTDLEIPEEADLHKLLDKAVAEGKKLPRLYVACGTEDGLYPDSVEMREHLTALSVPVTYEEWPGIHDWIFWDLAIQKGLKAVVR